MNQDNLNLLRQAFEAKLKDPSEKLTFKCREGVTFIDIEIFLGANVYCLSEKILEISVRENSLNSLIDEILEFLRSRRVVLPDYQASDITRETIALLDEIADAVYGDEKPLGNRKVFWDIVREKIAYYEQECDLTVEAKNCLHLKIVKEQMIKRMRKVSEECQSQPTQIQ